MIVCGKGCIFSWWTSIVSLIIYLFQMRCLSFLVTSTAPSAEYAADVLRLGTRLIPHFLVMDPHLVHHNGAYWVDWPSWTWTSPISLLYPNILFHLKAQIIICASWYLSIIHYHGYQVILWLQDEIPCILSRSCTPTSSMRDWSHVPEQ